VADRAAVNASPLIFLARGRRLHFLRYSAPDVGPGAEAIIDDLSARRCAHTFGIPVRGTLGLVLIAKQRGEIPAARPVLEDLRSAGMYLSERVLNRALRRGGE